MADDDRDPDNWMDQEREEARDAERAYDGPPAVEWGQTRHDEPVYVQPGVTVGGGDPNPGRGVALGGGCACHSGETCRVCNP